ncbi:hypothetical protein BTUL_0292g00080 [Botrytis tulipae]|uniref:MalT-like TPR region domain-containing protein n=1 Tax=Botrytis tulipae TaxID=87230 RepID=A0A4Z1E972_9HELO|nr:hypothetical protein BTUL_0292g00080 [Botrytis tulipae]
MSSTAIATTTALEDLAVNSPISTCSFDYLQRTSLYDAEKPYLMECGTWEEELELMKTAMRLCTDKEGLVYANLANTLGEMECERGHLEAAHEYMDKSLEIRRRLLPPNHEEVANGLNNYGNIILQNLDTGDCEKALKYYEECIRINMQCPESHNRKFLHIPHTNIARLLRVTEDYAGSIRHTELSRKYSIDFLGPDNHFDGLLACLHSFMYSTTDSIYSADYHVGNAHYDQGRYDDAERYWKQALSCFTQESETHPTTIAAKLKLSCIAIKRKQYDIAILQSTSNDLSKILIIAQLNESSKGDKGETARVLRRLAEAYELNGDQEQGSNYKMQAETIRKQIQGARFEKLPDEDQSYAMMSFHAFW